MKRVLLLVDLSNLMYKACAAYPDLTCEDTFTGGLYGFMSQVSAAILVTKATDVVVCEDAPPYLRAMEHPVYKSDRGTPDEQLVKNGASTKPMIRDLVQVLGWPLWNVRGFESDDIVAWAVDTYWEGFDRVIAASNDSDLYQLFSTPNFAVYRGKKGFYSRDDFIAEYGEDAIHQWATILAMAGTHNAVPGIDRIGVATAIKVLRDPPRYRRVLGEHGALIERNLDLITLPHPKFPEAPELSIDRKGYSERSLLRFAARYDITVTARMREAFGNRHG